MIEKSRPERCRLNLDVPARTRAQLEQVAEELDVSLTTAIRVAIALAHQELERRRLDPSARSPIDALMV